MKNLQNKLDSKEYAFDKEALWQKIEKPERNNRRYLVFWCFGIAALFIAGLFFFSPFNTSNELPIIAEETFELGTTKSKQETELTQPSTNVKEHKPITIQSKKEALNSATVHQEALSYHNKITNETNDIQLEQKAENVKKEYKKVVLQPKDIRSNNELQQHHFPSDKNTSEAIIDPKLPSILKESSKKTKYEFIQKNTSKEEKKVKDTTRLHLYSPIASLTPIVLSTNTEEVIDFKIKQFHSILHKKKNSLILSLGTGIHQNLFTGNQKRLIQIRETLEEAIEDFHLELRYERIINKNAYFFSGFAYRRFQDQIQTAQTQSSLLIEGFSLAQHLTTIRYELYNQYHFIDGQIGVGAMLNNGNWIFNIGAGIGFNLFQSQNGNFFDQQLEFRSMANNTFYDNSNFSVFGNLELGLRYQIEKRSVLGLALEGQTARSINKSNSEFNHKIRPVMIKLLYGYQF